MGAYRAPVSSRSLIGRPTREPRQVLDGILWILHTGAPWRDLPERFGPWNSVYNTFRRWQDAGRIDAILEALCNSSSMKKGSSISTCGAWTAPMSEHPKMLPVHKKHLNESSPWPFAGGFGSKIHLVTDGHGLPLSFCPSPGQSAEISYATSALAMARIPTSSGRYRTRQRILPQTRPIAAKGRASFRNAATSNGAIRGVHWYWTRCITAGAMSWSGASVG